MNTSAVARDPDIQGGAPVFSGTRVPIQNLFGFLQGGDSVEDFLAQVPSVSRAMVVSVLEAAQRALVDDAHPAR